MSVFLSLNTNNAFVFLSQLLLKIESIGFKGRPRQRSESAGFREGPHFVLRTAFGCAKHGLTTKKSRCRQNGQLIQFLFAIKIFLQLKRVLNHQNFLWIVAVNNCIQAEYIQIWSNNWSSKMKWIMVEFIVQLISPFWFLNFPAPLWKRIWFPWSKSVTR